MKNIIYVCSECGHESTKWYGVFPSYNKYNTFFEQEQDKSEKIKNVNSRLVIQKSEVQKLENIEIETNIKDITGINEFDRVNGGGLVKGSFSLLAGNPGIGKSTLLLQIVASLAKKNNVLYISGEESFSQIKLRAKRLGKKTVIIFIFKQITI